MEGITKMKLRLWDIKLAVEQIATELLFGDIDEQQAAIKLREIARDLDFVINEIQNEI